MDNSLKKFRVMTSKGEVIIDAKNIHDAISRARQEIGQLPNDINTKICQDIIDELTDLQNTIEDIKLRIKTSSKNLEWNDVYSETKQLPVKAEEYLARCVEKVGSMHKIEVDKNDITD